MTATQALLVLDALRLVESGYAPDEAIDLALAGAGVELSRTDRETIAASVWEREARG